jgi:hypothetical protein
MLLQRSDCVFVKRWRWLLLIGYGPPGDRGQLPSQPRDEDDERMAAEAYSKRRRARVRRAWLAGVVIIAALVAYLLVHLVLHLI